MLSSLLGWQIHLPRKGRQYIHHQSGGGKSGSIRMNRGMRISGRAGKPVLEAGLGVSLGNPNVIRPSADTVLQQDTAKLSNELVKYQLELAKKQLVAAARHSVLQYDDGSVGVQQRDGRLRQFLFAPQLF